MTEPTAALLPLSAVRPDPKNHREHSGLTPESIAALGEQMRDAGQLTPVWAEPDPDGEAGVFRLIAGHRRFYALQSIVAESVRALVFEGLTRAEVADLQGSENQDRVNVGPCEEAQDYRRRIEARIEDRPHLRWEDAFREVVRSAQKTAVYIRERLDLLKLPEEVRALIDQTPRAVGLSHARQLVRLIDANEGNTAECLRLARKCAADRGLTAEALKQKVNAYLEEQAQCCLFSADEAKDPAVTRQARSRAAALVAALERIAANTFDRREQAVNLGSLRADELATLEAELSGGQRHVGQVLSAVRSALGREADISPGPVVQDARSRPVEARQDVPAVEAAQEGATEDPAHQEAPARPIRQAVLTQPERVEFGGEVRVSVVGTWLWVFGVGGPGRSSLAWALQKAGARWASGRAAWYAPTEADAARVQEALREYLSQTSVTSVTSETSEPSEQAALAAAG